MNLGTIRNTLSLRSFFEASASDTPIKNVYISDLLSDVIANSEEGSLWITLQTHINIVAVAVMKNIPAIILANGRKPDEETIQKARSEGIVLLGSDQHSFEIAGKLYAMLHPK